MPAEQVTPPLCHHGEGPLWDRRGGVLRWVDLLAGDVLSLDTRGAVTRVHVGDVVAALRPRESGGFVVALERGFALADASLAEVLPLPQAWGDTSVRMNDGGCDPYGRFYCGSMGYGAKPGAGSLLRLDPDLSVHTVLEGVTISNGLEWSPDGSRAYYVDTSTQRIDLLDSDVDGLSNRRPWVTIPPELGSPDGLTVDAAGRVWVALWGGSAVHCYDTDGSLAARVEVPTPFVSSCAFGGPALDRLFITTSRQGGVDPDDVRAGALYTATVDATGQPVREFAH